MPWEETVYNSTPGFVADPETVARNTGRQIDWQSVPDTYKDGVAHTIVVDDDSAAAESTTLEVEALTVALSNGTVLDFGEHTGGHQMLAKLAAAAAVGDTELTVYPLSGAIEDDAEATYIDSKAGKKVIKAGTVMVQIAATGKIVPRSARPGSENAAMLLWTTATEDSRVDAKSGYGCLIGGVIYEDLLPEDISTWKSELATAGALFQYETYSDSREPSPA